MSYTETTTTSWFSRMKNAFFQIFIGIALILAAIYFLFWNEGRSIQTYRSLVEGAGLVISADSGKVDPANEGKLIHISGDVKAEGTAEDSDFGISAAGALAVSRTVEMYQWVEKSDSTTEKNVGGSEVTKTTYSYSKEWKSSPVDSSDFKVPDGHQNPGFAVNGSEMAVEKGTVGAYVLDGSKLASLGDDTPIKLNQADVDRIGSIIATDRPAKLSQGAIYLGDSATSPQIGDMKIGFKRTDLSKASFVGKQNGETLVAYTTSNGRDIFLSAAGEQDAQSMFKEAQSENAIITWLIRAGGLLAIFIGFQMMFAFFGVIGDIVPFIGSIVRGGTSLISLILTVIIGPVTIAIGWFAYRPILAASIIAVGVILAFLLSRMRRRQVSAAAAPTTAT